MSTTATITQSIFDAQTQALGLFKQGSESTAKAVESWTEFLATQVKAVLPEGVDTKALSPVLDAIPTPTKAVETSFSFIEDLMAQQREMTTKLVSSVEEITGSLTGARTGAAKPAAKK